MELRVLRYFLSVAREETISGAAEALNLTQPTLSRQMKELEAELGVTLFLRGSRRITLTDEGMRLRKRAEELVELADKTEAEFQSPPEAVGGEIFIGGGETHAMSIIARIIREIQSEHPNIRFNIYSGNADDVTERLDKGLMDFGVVIGPANLSKYDSLRLPAKDVWGVLIRADSPLAKLDSISPEDLWGVPLLTSRQRYVSNEIADWFRRDYGTLNVVATYNLIYNASLMVEQGIGYALCLDKLVNTNGGNLCFRPLEPRLEADIDIIWKKYQVFSKAAEVFLGRLNSEFTL